MSVILDDDDMTYEQKTAVKIKRETEKERATRLLTSTQDVMRTKEGRCVMYYVLVSLGWNRRCFVGNDPLIIAANAAVRDAATELYQDLLTKCPAMVPVMLKENQT